MKLVKVLAIQFKYLGDAVILTPALKTLATQIPGVQLHVLVAAEVAPLLEGLPWITKVWGMPRQRGKANLSQALPFIRALRRERFDRSVDFGGNDRGALLSYLAGAKRRLGSVDREGLKWLHKIFYTQIIYPENLGAPYYDLHFELLHAWNITRPGQLRMEIRLADSGIDVSSRISSHKLIICHISTSQPKKDWPISHWASLYHLAHQSDLQLTFSAGPNQRESKLLAELKDLVPEAEFLIPTKNLNNFLAVMKNCKIFVSGDTGPLHFAEGLGVPVLGIFGVGNSMRQVAPLYSPDKIVSADHCACASLYNDSENCLVSAACMSSIQPEQVFTRLKEILLKLDKSSGSN